MKCTKIGHQSAFAAVSIGVLDRLFIKCREDAFVRLFISPAPDKFSDQ